MGEETPTAISGGLGSGQFPVTRWSLVRHVQSPEDEPAAAAALSELCRAYWYPLYAFARRKGSSPSDAEDLTQGFFQMLITGEYLATVSQDKGKLRSFLLVAFKRHMGHERVRAEAQKRGGGVPHFPIDQGWAEDRYHHEPADHLTPEFFYDRHWARTLLEAALEELEENYRASGKAPLFEALRGFISPAAETSSYAFIAQRLEMTESAAKVAGHRLRKRYQKIVRRRIADTVGSFEEVDDEIQYLLSVYS